MKFHLFDENLISKINCCKISKSIVFGLHVGIFCRFICKSENRFGKNGLQEISQHPWFAEVSFDTLHQSTPPYIPDISGPEDTSNFDIDETDLKRGQVSPLILDICVFLYLCIFVILCLKFGTNVFSEFFKFLRYAQSSILAMKLEQVPRTLWVEHVFFS